jgi:hypothetical protein
MQGAGKKSACRSPFRRFFKKNNLKKIFLFKQNYFYFLKQKTKNQCFK